MLTRRKPSESHKRLVFKQSFENCLIGGVLGKNVRALHSGPYGYPTCKGGELITAVVFIFFGEVAKGPTCLDLLSGLSMDTHPSRAGGPARMAIIHPFLSQRGIGVLRLSISGMSSSEKEKKNEHSIPIN